MSIGIQYDEAWSRRIEAIYVTPDVVAQRQAVLNLLGLQPGDRVLDVGSVVPACSPTRWGCA